MEDSAMTNYAHGRHGGHSPGHVRDTFLKAVDAFDTWVGRDNGIGPEPKVEHEVKYEPVEISLTRACGLVWNSTDTLPGYAVDLLNDCDLKLTTTNYAGAARTVRRWIAEHTQPLPLPRKAQRKQPIQVDKEGLRGVAKALPKAGRDYAKERGRAQRRSP
jgi:hypothetical protein